MAYLALQKQASEYMFTAKRPRTAPPLCRKQVQLLIRKSLAFDKSNYFVVLKVHDSPPKIPPQAPNASLQGACLWSTVCCSPSGELKHLCNGIRKISKENPTCTCNPEDPRKQVLVPSDWIHTATETGSRKDPSSSLPTSMGA